MNPQPEPEIDTETPSAEANPRPPAARRLRKGQAFSINGSVYKVIAARDNGKITCKFMGAVKHDTK